MTNIDKVDQNVLDAVERLRPVLETYRDEAERERRLSDAVVKAMQNESLLKLWVPKAYGGAEADLVTGLLVVEELARLDSAAAWLFANATVAGAMVSAYLPESAARNILSGNPLLAGSGTPGGHAIPVEGGYRISGRWPLASGSHNATWLGGSCIVFDGTAPRLGPGGMPEIRQTIFPATAASVLDTWYSTGMRGTDSTDFVVEDVFVPEDMTFPFFTAQPRLSTGLYRLPLMAFFFTALACVGLGITRSAIDAFVALAKEKTPTMSQTGLAVRPTIHADVARAEALYQASRAYIHEVAREMMAAADNAAGLTDELEGKRRLACVFAAENCEKAVDLMFRLGGATSIYTGHRLDRCLRDIHTVNQHLAVSPVWWEKTGQFYFGLGLGMP